MKKILIPVANFLTNNFTRIQSAVVGLLTIVSCFLSMCMGMFCMDFFITIPGKRMFLTNIQKGVADEKFLAICFGIIFLSGIFMVPYLLTTFKWGTQIDQIDKLRSTLWGEIRKTQEVRRKYTDMIEDETLKKS